MDGDDTRLKIGLHLGIGLACGSLCRFRIIRQRQWKSASFRNRCSSAEMQEKDRESKPGSLRQGESDVFRDRMLQQMHGVRLLASAGEDGLGHRSGQSSRVTRTMLHMCMETASSMDTARMRLSTFKSSASTSTSGNFSTACMSSIATRQCLFSCCSCIFPSGSPR